jgi:Flp pilus assembly pilin Flp
MYLWLANTAANLRRDEEGQGVSEYAMILVLIVLIVVSVVHAIGSNAQQVIDKVNTVLHIG